MGADLDRVELLKARCPHRHVQMDPGQAVCPPRSGELRTQKLKVLSGENTELKRSPFKARSNNNNNKEFLYSAIL